MRLRGSNLKARQTGSDDGPDSDSEVLTTPRRGRPRVANDASDDEEFEADATFDASESEDDVTPGIRSHRAFGKDTFKPRRQATKRGPSTTPDPTALIPYPMDSRLTSTRLYHGVFHKLLRTYFYEDYYGPDPEATSAAVGIFRRWTPFDVLPSKLIGQDGSSMLSPWVPEGFEASQRAHTTHWYRQIEDAAATGAALPSKVEPADEDVAKQYAIQHSRQLSLLLGPGSNEEPRTLRPHFPVAFSDDDTPLNDVDDGMQRPSGWMFDVGGLVLSVAWAPRPQKQPQILALAVSPFADQDFDAFQEDDSPAGDQGQRGSIQIWVLLADPQQGGSTVRWKKPRLWRTLVFDWGRAKKLLWSPAAPSDEEKNLGVLAVLCADGLVHVAPVTGDLACIKETYERIHQPIASLGFPNEEDSRVTSFAWASINRLVTGHQDGSIALWSASPKACLFRQAVHHTHVLHLATGYPSQPHLVASHPVSGLSAFIDLSNPSSEITTTTNPSITPQHSMLEWSDHLQGFVSTLPSSKPLNTAVGFFHSRTFPATPRKVIEGDVLLSALAVGVHHPFVLTALVDGSVWACNPMNRVFLPRHAPPGWKIKIFHHEHVPRARYTGPDNIHPEPEEESVRSSRGISRILQGFKPVTNQGAKALEFATTGKAPGLKGKRRVKTKPKKTDEQRDDQTLRLDDEDDGTMYADPSKLVVHEPLSRVMSMAWNPNLDCATWAVFGMASGLVRIQDIGVEH